MMENTIYSNANVVALNPMMEGLNFHINLFLNKIAPNSRRQYKSNFNRFFIYMINKNYEDVTWEDITNPQIFSIRRVEQFCAYLQHDKNLKNQTINSYVRTIANLFDRLNAYNSNVNPNIFKLTETLSSTTNHYGALSLDELESLLKFAKSEKQKPEIKSIAMEFMLCTGMRKSAVLSLRWQDIVEAYDFETNTYYKCVKDVHDKTKNVTVPIAPQLYEHLLPLKPPTEDGLIFPIHESTLRETFNKFCKEYNLDKKGRDLGLHSIKHSGVLHVMYKTGNDIEVAAKYAGHSRSQTTLNYTNKKIDLASDPRYTFFDKIDLSIVENASKEDLIEAIKNSCPQYIQNAIIKFLKSK